MPTIHNSLISRLSNSRNFQRLAILLFLNALYFVFLFSILPGRFEENDDIMMCMIANGNITGSPDYHLVFINAIYGKVLQFLYSTFHGIEWYTLLFSIFHILSITVIAKIVISDNNWKPMVKLAYLLFLYILWARVIVSFQFTTTAGLLCFAGCLLLLKIEKNAKLISSKHILSFLLIIIGSLIRFKAAGLVALIFAPFFIQKVFLDKRFITFPALIFCSALLLQLGDQCLYKGEWTSYREYNTARGIINDNPNTQYIQSTLPENITEENFNALLSFFQDPSIIGISELNELSHLIQNVPFRQSILNIKGLITYRIPLLLLSILLVLSVSFVRNFRMISIPFTILLFLLFASIAYFGTLKNRVFIIMIIPSFYLACDLLSKINEKRRTKEYVSALVVCILALASSKYILQTYKTTNITRYKIELLRSHNSLLSEKRGPKYIIGLYYWEAINPFKINENNVRPICAGWLTNFPIQEVKFNKYPDLIAPPIYQILELEQGSMLKELLKDNYDIIVNEHIIAQNDKYKLITLGNSI